MGGVDLVATQALDQGLELYPVQLRDGLVELCAYHDDSESLILADLLFNFQQARSGLARLVYRLIGFALRSRGA